ncbi:MAG TPA: glutamyl-tRNA reductase, partial [Microthrixaceae bacterium]|nr:glutamyl-tRNA reductase [Microthrixaceae bacterium]
RSEGANPRVSVVVIGANHRTASLELLERMVVSGDRLPKLLHALDDAPDVSEAVVLATCNRTEVYLVAEKFHAAYCQVRDFFSDLTFLPPDEFADSLYMHYDDQAIRHLFEVSAGLDSAVPGEHEILGQVRRAWEIAREEGTSRRSMNMIFRHAVGVGKRARTETRISHHVTSVSQAAVILAGEYFTSETAKSTASPADSEALNGDATLTGSKCAGSAAAAGLEGRRAVVVGAGSMAKGMASFLAAADVSELVIVNRSVERAESLAEQIRFQNGFDRITIGGLSDLTAALTGAELLLTATGADDPVVSFADLPDQISNGSQSLLVVDVGMPRDVDPAVAGLDNVNILDMETISALTEANLAARHAETDAVGAIVDEEIRSFANLVDAREAAPVITSLRSQAEQVRQGELERFSNRLAGLDDSQAEAVEALTRAVVAKLLHEPSVRLKDSAGSALGDRLADSVRDLFGLD